MARGRRNGFRRANFVETSRCIECSVEVRLSLVLRERDPGSKRLFGIEDKTCYHCWDQNGREYHKDVQARKLPNQGEGPLSGLHLPTCESIEFHAGIPPSFQARNETLTSSGTERSHPTA